MSISSNTGNPQGELMGIKFIRFRFHTFVGSKTNEIVLKIDEFIGQGKGEYGQRFTPETSFVELPSWE